MASLFYSAFRIPQYLQAGGGMIPPPGGQGGGTRKRKAYVYLLRSVATKQTYLGWTTDLLQRLEEHNVGQSGYTKTRGPWEIIGYEVYEDPDVAKQRERMLKRHPRQLAQFKKRSLHVFRTASGGQRRVGGMIPPPARARRRRAAMLSTHYCSVASPTAAVAIMRQHGRRAAQVVG